MYLSMRAIPRSEAEDVKAIPGWVLLYGRRKVGKTFLLRHFVPHDAYFSVRRDGSVLFEGPPMESMGSPTALMERLGGLLRAGRTVVMDEFQRLPDAFLDDVAILHPSGRLVLSGSAMGVVGRVLGRKAPLLGLASPYRLGLVRPSDALLGLDAKRDGSNVPHAAYLRDPWLVDILQPGTDFTRALHKALGLSRLTVPALIGEIFLESDRSLSQVYEGVIRGLGAGLWAPGDLAQRLHEMGLTSNGASASVMPYISNLEEMGLVESLPVHGKVRKRAYRLPSPIMDTYYYLADKHQVDEVDRPLAEIGANLERSISRGVERFVGALFHELEGGQLEQAFDPEIDIVVTRGRKRVPVLVGEVKWGKYDQGDVAGFARKVEGMSCRKVFVARSPKAPRRVGDIEVMGPGDLLDIARTVRRARLPAMR